VNNARREVIRKQASSLDSTQ